MDDDKIELLRLRLGQEEVKDFEKNCVKWVDQALKKLHGEFMNDYAVLDLVARVINFAKKTNSTQLLSPHILSWVNDILSRIRQASNSDVYLSILLILLSSFGGPCRQVKRKMWLNLATFASSPDNILRMKAATILAAASTKDLFEDLYNEVLIILDQISPLILSKKFERPSERTLGTLNDSLLILNQTFQDDEEVEESAEILHNRLHFTICFLRGHILYHGCVDFPVEEFFALLRQTSVVPGVLKLLSALALSIVKSHSAEMLLVNNNVAEVLSSLYASDKVGVADAVEETLLEWINQVGVLGSLHRTKNFERLAEKIFKKLEKPEIKDIALLRSFVTAYGTYIKPALLVDATSTVFRRLVNDSQVNGASETIPELLKIVQELTQLTNSKFPTPLLLARQLARLYLSSRSPVAKEAARSLLNTTTRLQRPFHRFQLVKNDHALQLNLKPTNSEDNDESESLGSISSGLKRLEAKLDKLGTRGVSVLTNGAREEDVEPMEFSLSPQKGVSVRRRSSHGLNEEDCKAKKDSETLNGSDYESDSQNGPKKETENESSQELSEILAQEAADSGGESLGEDMDEEENAEMESFEVIPSKIRRLEEPPIIISQSSYKLNNAEEKKEMEKSEQVEPNEEVKRLMAMFDTSKTP